MLPPGLPMWWQGEMDNEGVREEQRTDLSQGRHQGLDRVAAGNMVAHRTNDIDPNKWPAWL